MSHLIVLAAVAAVPVTPPERLAALLSAPAFAVREAAADALWHLGDAGRPALRTAAGSGSPEAARRANELLERLDWGLYADTPPAVAEQVRRFRAGPPDESHDALAELIRGDALPTARVLLGRPLDAAARDALAHFLVRHLRREVPSLIVGGDRDRVGRWLALHAFNRDPAGLADLTLFEHLRGKPEPSAPASARLDVFRKRAAGELAAAAAIALPFPPLWDALLEDAGDWATLADRPITEANSGDGLRAFRLRRAGRHPAADALLDEQVGSSLAPPVRYQQALDEPTLALVLNDRAAQASARLARTGYRPHILADWLTSQLRFADALKLIDPDAERPPELETTTIRALYGTRRGRLLAQLGRRADAEQTFRDAFRAVRAGEREDRVWTPYTAYPLEQLVRAEVRAGRPDLACDHLGDTLDGDGWDRRSQLERRGGAFEALFETDAEIAPALLRLILPRGPGGEGLRRVRALLAGKASAEDVGLVAGAKRPPAADDPERARQVGQGVAAVLRAANRPEDAAKVFAEVADALPPPGDDAPSLIPGRPPGAKSWVYNTDERIRFWVEFGDTLAGLGRHREAADRLFQGWQRFPDSPTLLFLSGRMLVKAGHAADGRARMEAAHWVSLGAPGPRGRLMEELLARGLVAEADRERRLAVLSGWASTESIGNVWSQAAKAATLAGDFTGAAHLYQRSVHYVLKTPGVHFVDGSGYLTVPQSAAAAEARGLLASGNVPEAVAAAEACLGVLPGNTELTVAVVGGLDKAGRRADADKLFRRAWDGFRRVIADHPETAWARAEAAWLAAGCRRELDAALTLAEEAVRREPESLTTRRALAEVRFRRGDRGGAVAVVTALAGEDRLSHLFRRQIERYKSAPLDAPPPDTDDD